MRLQGKLQANRGCVTLQRRGCRSNSGLEILRRTRSFPERTNSAGSVAAILWQLEIFVYRERHLIVDHDELALVRPAIPLQEDPGALVAQQPQLRAAVGGRAVVGDLQLAPARPVLRQEEIVREVGGVGHDERVGGEELRPVSELVAADHAARRHSSARGREGAVQALAVQRARGGRPGMVSVAPVSDLMPSACPWTRRPPW